MRNAELLEELGIDLKKRTSGSLKTVCPMCSETRKHKKDPCLSVDIDEGVYNCHNCEFKGRVFEKKLREYVKPLPRLEKVSAKTLQFFEETRKISNHTLLRMKISESKEFVPQLDGEANCVCFNYYRNGQLVNIKFRGPRKSFFMAKDAELIFYNLDAMQGVDEVIIVEGEIDCLSFIEAKTYNVVSVPNGASKGSQKLEYLDNCWDAFKDIKKAILVTDDDEAGRALREELARRIGKEKCWTADYPQEARVPDKDDPSILRAPKDSNEVLVHFNAEALQTMIKDAKPWPLEGIMPMEDILPVVADWYENGYPTGTKAGIKGLDHLLRFVPGQITTISGIPSHGKDEYFNWVFASLAKNEGWTFGICGFEESPAETTTKVAEKVIGKSFAHRKHGNDRMSVGQVEQAVAIIDKHFHFYNTNDISGGLDSLLNIAKMLVARFGIQGLVFNPWNWIEHDRPPGVSETDYVSQVYTRLILFARLYGVHVFVIAHTTKMVKDKKTMKYEVPTLYNIAGSANFYNKTHNGVVIYRDEIANTVDVYVQKVKQSWLGQKGFSTYTFDTSTRQYRYVSSNIEPDPLPTGLPTGSWRQVDVFNPDQTEKGDSDIEPPNPDITDDDAPF